MKSLFLFALLLISTLAYTQSTRIDELIEFVPQKVDVFPTDSLPTGQLALRMDYGSAEIMNPADYYNLVAGGKILKVQLIYTDYAQSKTFKQPNLNRKRFKELSYLHYGILEDSTVQWEVIAQTKCTSPSEGCTMFHGFVLTYVPSSTKTATTFISSILDDNPTNDLPLEDSTVLKVFERNRSWNKMLITADLTGSMYPYIGQVLLWLKLNFNAKKAKHFVFFNDGDNKPDTSKVMGNTGGVYDISTKNFQEVVDLAYGTIKKGNGGDNQENDIEALLKGLERCPDCTDIVLIADNWASMRDFALIKDLNKPIKIILCGSEFGINLEYLNLAKATGGSIHTIEEDIMNLMEMKEGEVIEIEGQKYVIENGEFQILTKG